LIISGSESVKLDSDRHHPAQRQGVTMEFNELFDLDLQELPTSSEDAKNAAEATFGGPFCSCSSGSI
jgi:hypothetical protein